MALSDDPIVQGGTPMHHKMHNILDCIRQDVARHLRPESISEACNIAGHKWRKCILDPVAIVHWFLLQILHGNTSVEHVARLADGLFTGVAYCLARKALPLKVFQILLEKIVASLVPDTLTNGLWHGHRTLLIDGSGFSMPDTPDLQAKCGFPVAKILALFHAATGALLDVVTMPLRSHDMSGVSQIIAAMNSNDVLVGDRGLCSFAHLAMLQLSGIYGVFRAHQRQIIDFTHNRPHVVKGKKGKSKGLPTSRWHRSLGILDQVVEWFKPTIRPKWMTAEEYAKHPSSLRVRELKYQVTRPGFRATWITLVTTLLDAEVYPSEDLAQLYQTRWQVEVNLRNLKITMKMDVLRCKTVNGVLKELTMYAIVYNLVCVVMTEASRRQGVPVNRISFIDVLRWLETASPGDELPEFVVNPTRPGRVEPRVKKRRPKQYDLMNKPRAVLRKGLLSQGLAT
jgi:hypothetical protein